MAIISLIVTIALFQKNLSTKVAAYGGEFREGIIGAPRFVNPILAESPTDRSLVRLVYSSLLKRAKDGSLTYDVAESLTISEDALTYTVKLRNDIRFHDRKTLDADDVLFTIDMTQQTNLNSPYRIAWDLISVTAPDPMTIIFKLPQPYAGFEENLTLGILPEHLWRPVALDQFSYSEYNVSAVGSGPYKIRSLNTHRDGIPLSYELSSYHTYHLGRPFINKLTLKFYENETKLIEAFSKGAVDAISEIHPENGVQAYASRDDVLTTPLPRIFGLFAQQVQNPALGDQSVINAISTALDRSIITERILHGYAHPQNRALPVGFVSESSQQAVAFNIEQAREILDSAGWKLTTGVGNAVRMKGNQTLTFTLTTVDSPELLSIAEEIRNQLSLLDIPIIIRSFPIDDLQQDIIRARSFEMLLFGQTFRHDSDLYSFWHSSQRGSSGLNITQYNNSQTDALLEKVRETQSFEERQELNERIEDQLALDASVIFLYTPDFVYMSNGIAQGVTLPHIRASQERFTDVHNWFIHTERIWNIFTQ